ncbi:hypothetical protein J31TS4_46280 [Paenibacillus sp. J31TS4]|uniref:nucleoside triphosphate pyrophosphohydrolase n=1 Tax=Paenibacillus sp. J31TS4 TaxID=2807195 RepID=UPI001B00BD25|nr:nucleoside triphosphate pyrophosphohydrolase [Paenibacillus sp. J31TS4]GIP41348.1 hypothetical protein J31TS4_46280 [Paenibacillus sp. J31TS4]
MAARLTVVGLGSGDETQLTLGIWDKLRQADALFLRTEQHPVTDYMKRSGVAFRSFDSLYEEQESFDGVYAAIADRLIEEARSGSGELVYAVPGHPMVAERTTQLLKQRCPEAGIPLQILGGESFLDQAFVRFGFDPIEGFQLLDATALEAGGLNPRVHTVIAQVYDAFTASDVKLALMERYPDDYPVVVGHALGVEGQEEIQEVPLYELDRLDGYGNLSLIWVPRSDEETLRSRSFERLKEIVAILRSPDGCPWDREQTHASIRRNLIEETYEVLETIDDDDPDAMCEELGDLLLQVVMHAQMEAETGAFTVEDVLQGINDKLIRRHPHVFGDREANDAEEALGRWQEMKREEKRKKGIDVESLSVLAGVPRDLPALMKAHQLQKKAAKVGFDWDQVADVYAKLEEELAEVKEAAESAGASESERDEARAAVAGEVGDLLFAVVNLARFLKVEPEEALTLTNRKFVSRFSYIEEQLRLKGKRFDQTDLQELETYWQEAKKLRPSGGR